LFSSLAGVTTLVISAPFWIVDKKGWIRVGMDADATPTDIVTNVRVLLNLK